MRVWPLYIYKIMLKTLAFFLLAASVISAVPPVAIFHGLGDMVIYYNELVRLPRNELVDLRNWLGCRFKSGVHWNWKRLTNKLVWRVWRASRVSVRFALEKSRLQGRRRDQCFGAVARSLDREIYYRKMWAQGNSEKLRLNWRPSARSSGASSLLKRNNVRLY